MLYLLDTANLVNIEKTFDTYPMDGVTTNPTIISQENTDFFEHLNKIRTIIGEDSMLHVQLVSTNFEDMIKEAKYLLEKMGDNIYIKIPVTSQGIKTMKYLHKSGVKITATAVFTALQALTAAKAGADFVAPYVNRSDNINSDGVAMVSAIVKLFKNYGMKTQVLAASFINVQQVYDTIVAGAHAVTVNMSTFENALKHPLTDTSIERFTSDWESIYGVGNTIVDLK